MANWNQCAGRNFDTPSACCNDDFACFRKNNFFSQCRPASMSVPTSWDGEILTCTGVNNAVAHLCPQDCTKWGAMNYRPVLA